MNNLTEIDKAIQNPFNEQKALLMAILYKRTSTNIDECIKDAENIYNKLMGRCNNG